MKRTTIWFLLITMLLPAALPGTGHAASLRDRVEIDGATVRLDDLFVLDTDGKNAIVSDAPMPGKREVFTAQRLAGIAQRFEIDWTPQSRYDRVVVHRAGRSIAPHEIEDAVRAQLARDASDRDLSVSLNARNIRAVAAVDQPEPFRIVDLRVDRRAGRFSALMIVPHSDHGDEQVAISGIVSEVVEIPVVNRRIQRGEIVSDADVHWVKVDKSELARDVVMDASSLVGQSARRILGADRPVRLTDLRAPIVIRKGEIVTVILQTQHMRITAQAAAAHDASIGDTIRVINTHSKKTIEGLVAAPNQVIVSMAASALN